MQMHNYPKPSDNISDHHNLKFLSFLILSMNKSEQNVDTYKLQVRKSRRATYL
jgi:hypothetical protein